MAIAQVVLKKTNQEACVKVFGDSGNNTILLAIDILASTQALDGGTQAVNIVGVSWTGAVGSTITITRGGVVILTMAGEAATEFDFNACGYVDNINNTSDIQVSISGGQAQVYLVLRKVSGYATKVETASFGSYDNTTAVGS